MPAFRRHLGNLVGWLDLLNRNIKSARVTQFRRRFLEHRVAENGGAHRLSVSQTTECRAAHG